MGPTSSTGAAPVSPFIFRLAGLYFLPRLHPSTWDRASNILIGEFSVLPSKTSQWGQPPPLPPGQRLCFPQSPGRTSLPAQWETENAPFSYGAGSGGIKFLAPEVCIEDLEFPVTLGFFCCFFFLLLITSSMYEQYVSVFYVAFPLLILKEAWDHSVPGGSVVPQIWFRPPIFNTSPFIAV